MGSGDAGGAAVNTHFEIAAFQFCAKFYVTSFNVFLLELAVSELQNSP